ncbi:MAG: hypothetical protein RL488_646 [Actinomycetota bacterium]|jgi:DNA-binding XRE family transcriptional regulator
MGRKPKDQEDRVVNRIEELRSARGISRQELADVVGVHYQTVGYIERGEYSPSLLLALRMAHALRAKVEDLFQIEGEN